MQKIILLGFMGSGKSTLGRNLAHRLGVPFVDTDHEIELLKDRTVEQIFQEEGESVFREHERQIIEVLSAIDTDFVLAVGGGLPCYNNLIEKLNMLGITVYLKNSPEVLAERLLNDKQVRPLISGLSRNELEQFIQEKLKVREPFYSQALITIEGDTSTEAILHRLLHRKS